LEIHDILGLMAKVLVVDDDSVFPLTLRDALEKENFKVEIANNGLEGIEHVKKEKPDLVILDLMMPKMGGFPFLEAMQKEFGDTKIPVLITTSLSDSTSFPSMNHKLPPSPRERLTKRDILWSCHTCFR